MHYPSPNGTGTRLAPMLHSPGITCVTISHRPALEAFHHTKLALDGKGGYDVGAIDGGAAGAGFTPGGVPPKYDATLNGAVGTSRLLRTINFTTSPPLRLP